MTFWQNVLSTGIGAVLGFVFSIVLFYISQRVQKNTWRRDLRNSVSKELEYDRDYIQTQLDALNQSIERLGNDEREIFPLVRFSGLRTTAWGQYVTSGYVWDDLDPSQVAEFDEMLWNMGPSAEQLVFLAVERWKEGEADKTTTYGPLNWKREQLRGYVQLLNRLNDKVGALAT